MRLWRNSQEHEAGFHQETKRTTAHHPKDTLFALPSPAARTGRATEPVRLCTSVATDAKRHRTSAAVGNIMTPEEYEKRIVSPDRLRELTDSVGPDTCRRYVSNFIDMWDGRLTRLQQAVQLRDFDAAMDVVLSIKISSHMAGAERLSALGAAAQDLVSRRDHRGLEELVASVQACGVETMALLNESRGLFPAA